MGIEIAEGYGRIIAARTELLELRSGRIEQLLLLREYLRELLDSFVMNVDPLGGARLAELVAEGSKASGDVALSLVFFDGTKLRFAVDPHGRFSGAATPPELAPELAGMVDLVVGADLKSARIVFGPLRSAGTAASGDVSSLVARLVAYDVGNVERQVQTARTGGGTSLRVA